MSFSHPCMRNNNLYLSVPSLDISLGFLFSVVPVPSSSEAYEWRIQFHGWESWKVTQGPAFKNPTYDLMLYCHHLRILDIFKNYNASLILNWNQKQGNLVGLSGTSNRTDSGGLVAPRFLTMLSQRAPKPKLKILRPQKPVLESNRSHGTLVKI